MTEDDAARGETGEIVRPGERSGTAWPGLGGSATGRGSVTGALAELRAADPRIRDAAAQRLWERFAPRLCALARSRLNPRIRVREDEDDIVQSLFRRFFAVQRARGYALDGREALWRLLVRMTLCKVANAAQHHRRARRDVRRERSPDSWAEAAADGGGPPSGPAPFRSLSPEEEAISRIELARMLDLLGEDQRQLLVWKLEGHTNAEIGRRIGRTERTVELKMGLIRGILERDRGVSRELARGRDGGR